MKLKKMMLLGSVVLALAAFAQPGTASAKQWMKGGKALGVGGEVFKWGGKLSLTTTGGTFRVGLCEYNLVVNLWNEGGAAGGEVTAATIGPGFPCETNVPGCVLVGAETGGLPWQLNVTAGGTVDIEEIFFELSYEGCEGIEKNVQVAGTLTGTYNNILPGFNFQAAGDLQTEFGPTFVDGLLFEVSEQVTLE